MLSELKTHSLSQAIAHKQLEDKTITKASRADKTDRV